MNRRKWSNEEKVTVVLEMIKGVEPVASICAKHGVSATQAYKWLEQFFRLEGVRISGGERMIE